MEMITSLLLRLCSGRYERYLDHAPGYYGTDGLLGGIGYARINW